MVEDICASCANTAPHDTGSCVECSTAATREGDHPDHPGAGVRVPGSLVTWAAVVLAGLAVGALLVTQTAPPVQSKTTVPIDDFSPTHDAPASLEEVNPPLRHPVTIDRPAVGEPVRHRIDGQALIFAIELERCGSEDGMIGASGTIRNHSRVGQAVDYTIRVELVRALTGATVGEFQAEVDGVAAGEAEPWLVEMRSSRVVKLRCLVTSLTATPHRRLAAPGEVMETR